MRARTITCNRSELITEPNSSVWGKPSSWNWIKQIGVFLVDILAKTHELKVKQIIDRKGNVSWQVYDPTRQQTFWFYSEEEVRAWLDRQFQ